jgi:chromosome transmission fidelity protein 18
MEVNASDERSSSVLTDRVRRAMESTTINFNKNHPDYGRPNCIILDEIDGADAKGAVQSLVDIIRADMAPKGAKRKNTYLRRPIIFICNHKYAPSLRPLLPFARHFNVDPPQPARLVARLKAVLSHENMPMTAAGSLLHQLVVASGGDIRSCMYTLQFASAEAKDSMEFSQALGASLGGTGLKDHRNDVASTVTAVFRKPKDGRIAGVSENDRVSVSRVIDAVQGLGDTSALINSIFTNLLSVSYIDPTLDRCAVAHELLSSTDVHRSGSMGIDYSAPPATAAIHLLCRVETKPDLSFSTRELFDAQYRKIANQGLLQRFAEGLSPKCRSLKFQEGALSSEVIPQLAWILSAGEGSSALCRASSSMEVLTVKERVSMNQHVSVLSSLGLTYVADHEEESGEANRGTSYSELAARRLRMEPPIDRLIRFGGVVNGARKEIPSAVSSFGHRLETFMSLFLTS